MFLISLRSVQYFVLVFFTIMTCASVVVIPSIEPGLDQELSMAKDHHVVKYFQVGQGFKTLCTNNIIFI